EHRASNMRSDEAHASPRRGVDHAGLCIAYHAEIREVRFGFFEHDAGRVYPALRFHPFKVETCATKFVVGYEVVGARDLTDVEVAQGRHGIALAVGLHIDVGVVRIDAGAELNSADATDRILGQQPPCLAADEPHDLGENGWPQRGIEGRVVDVAD